MVYKVHRVSGHIEYVDFDHDQVEFERLLVVVVVVEWQRGKC